MVRETHLSEKCDSLITLKVWTLSPLLWTVLSYLELLGHRVLRLQATQSSRKRPRYACTRKKEYIP
jgi:hypothetical protein